MKKRPTPKLIGKSGVFRVQIARCFVKESTRLQRMIQITEYRIVGQKTLYAVVDRVTPDHVASFKRGQRFDLETRLRMTTRGLPFIEHTWHRPLGPAVGS